MKNVLLFLFVAVLFGAAVLSCSDGKLNLLLLSYGDQEDPPEYVPDPGEPLSSSNFAPPAISSSSNIVAIVSSSSELSIPTSSSSNRGVRSSPSSSKVDKEGNEYIDYPVLEPGAPGVFRPDSGGITRYWDGCKPSCSRAEHLFQEDRSLSPNGIARQCDKNGTEMPVFYRMNPVEPTWAEFLSTPNACVPDNTTYDWPQSSTYAEWKAQNPNTPSGAQAAGYICSADQIPYAVNDTLAYAFAANSTGNCGKCFMLQFIDEWNYGATRPSHRGLKGKTLIVMVNNFGVSKSAFDIMIPGGGVGMYNAVSEQLGLPSQPQQQTDPSEQPQSYGALGAQYGGLLTECTFGSRNLSFNDIGGGLTPADRATLEETQECLRVKCNRAFKNHPTHLKGCLWHVDWFMAADNPEAYSKEVPCPQYLLDRYSSTYPLPTRPADLNPNANCKIGGGTWDCPAP